MATLTITSATGTDTTNAVLNYPGQDAQKIFNLWTKYVWNLMRHTDNASPPNVVPPPVPTHQDFTNWCAQHMADIFQDWNKRDGTVTTAPPPINIS